MTYDDDGVTVVLNASPKFELLSKTPIGERCYSSPAFSDGQIFFRGEKASVLHWNAELAAMGAFVARRTQVPTPRRATRHKKNIRRHFI